MQHNALVQDCFHSILRLRSGGQGDSLTLAQDVHAVLSQALEAMIQRPHALGLSEQDASEMAYAIVALADETALSQHDDVAVFWSTRMLQTQFFNENDAGEQFFRRLDRLLIQTSARRTTVMTYYTALSLGFVGRFGGFSVNASGLEKIRSTVHQALSDAGALVEYHLSPRALSTPRKAVNNFRSTLLRRVDWALLAGALIALLCGILLRSVQEGRINAVIERSELALARIGRTIDDEKKKPSNQRRPSKTMHQRE